MGFLKLKLLQNKHFIVCVLMKQEIWLNESSSEFLNLLLDVV